MQVSVSVVKGLNKKHSEDTVLVDSNLITENYYVGSNDDIKCIVVADGVGGYKGGRDASQYILKYIIEKINTVENEEDLERLIKDGNVALIAYGKQNGLLHMATTLTGLFWVNKKVLLAHVGNTRLSVFQGNYLKQLTKDHTTYQRLLQMGNYEAAEGCNKSEICGCLGGGDSYLARWLVIKEVFNYGMPKTVILTSDGIHDYVDVDSLEEVFDDNDDDSKIIDKLNCLANDNGSVDDKSIVIIRNR